MNPAGLRLLRALTVVGLSAAYFAFVFRLGSGVWLTAGLGDWIDPYFINYLLEHWRYSLLHAADPSSPAMFFPAQGTLGHSHGLILYAPFYIASRIFLEPLPADTVSLWLVMETGALALYVLLRRFIGLTFVEALVVTAFFCLSRNVVNGLVGVWTQWASVFLIPSILLVGAWSARMPRGTARAALAWLFGFLSALILVQDHYTALFAVLIGALFVPGTWPFLAPFVRRVPEAWATTRRAEPNGPRHLPSKAWAVIASVAAVWAMVILVHPIAQVTIGPLRFSAENHRRPLTVALIAGGWYVIRRWRPFERAARFIRRISQFQYALALTTGLLMGGALFLWIYLGPYLSKRAFPLVDLLSSTVVLDPSRWQTPGDFLNDIWAFASPRSFVFVALLAALAFVPKFNVDKRYQWFAAWSVLVAAIVTALPLRYGHLLVWQALGWVPGLSAIRDPKRIVLVYELTVALGAAWFLAGLPARSWQRRSTVALLLAFGIVFWSRPVFEYRRPIAEFQQWVQTPIAIDRSCESFYVKAASAAYMARSAHPDALHSIDAMFISLAYSIPTLNGFSAVEPPDWVLGNPPETAYLERVSRWIARHQLRGVCELDLEARTMTPTGLGTGSK